MTQPKLLEMALERAAGASNFIQGEVLGIADACVVLAEASAPLSHEAIRVATTEGVTSGLIIVPHAVDNVVVLTQTCDLQLTTPNEYWCLVAPAISVAKTRAHEASRGRRPGLAALPWVDDTSVADLSRITTIERSILLGAPSSGRPRTPRERFHFAEAVSRYLTRPAMPDLVNEVLAPFVKRVAEKHDRQSPEGRRAHEVSELRLEATPDLDDDRPALNVLMIMEEADMPRLPSGTRINNKRVDDLVKLGRERAAQAVHDASDAIAKREAWTALAELWIQPAVQLAAHADGIGSMEITVLNGEELTYARSLNAPILDLRYLSTRAA